MFYGFWWSLLAYWVTKQNFYSKTKLRTQVGPCLMTCLPLAPPKMDDGYDEIQDMLIEVNLRIKDEPKPTFISVSMLDKLYKELIVPLHAYKSYFALYYHEIHGL